MHTTHETCCPERVTLEVTFCRRTNTYRIRGQWNPEQLQFFDDAVHDVELTAGDDSQIRPCVVQVLRHFLPLLRLSEGRASRGIHTTAALGVPLVVDPAGGNVDQGVASPAPDHPGRVSKADDVVFEGRGSGQ